LTPANFFAFKNCLLFFLLLFSGQTGYFGLHSRSTSAQMHQGLAQSSYLAKFDLMMFNKSHLEKGFLT